MSEKGAIKKSTAQAICDAVRSKEGSTEPIPVNALAERITALPTSSGDDNLAKLAKGTLTELTAKDLEGVTSIPENFIYNPSESFKNLTLPEGLTKIGARGFFEVKLENLTIPYSLVDVGSLTGAGINGSTENLYFSGGINAYLGTSISNVRRKNVYIDGKTIQHLVLDNSPNATNRRPPAIAIDYAYRISDYAFYGCENLLSFTSGVGRLQTGSLAFSGCKNLKTVTFRTKRLDDSSGIGSTPNYRMNSNLFSSCASLTDVYVPWSEGEISNAPWGATNATIHYNSPIPFTIDGVEYQCVLNQRWSEWLDSEYNTGGFYLDGGYIRTPDGKYLYYSHGIPTKLYTNAGKYSVHTEGTAYFSQEG